MYSFVNRSFVHNEWLKIQKEEYPNEKIIELHRLSDTRWSSHVVACNAVSKRFSTFINLYTDCLIMKTEIVPAKQ